MRTAFLFLALVSLLTRISHTRSTATGCGPFLLRSGPNCPWAVCIHTALRKIRPAPRKSRSSRRLVTKGCEKCGLSACSEPTSPRMQEMAPTESKTAEATPELTVDDLARALQIAWYEVTLPRTAEDHWQVGPVLEFGDGRKPVTPGSASPFLGGSTVKLIARATGEKLKVSVLGGKTTSLIFLPTGVAEHNSIRAGKSDTKSSCSKSAPVRMAWTRHLPFRMTNTVCACESSRSSSRPGVATSEDDADDVYGCRVSYQASDACIS